MKSIYNTIHSILDYKQKNCASFDNGRCSQQRCDCRIYADIWGHIGCTVPDAYHNVTLQDFNGMHNGDVVLSKGIVRKARDEIIKYCWNDIAIGEDYDHSSWFPKSIIDKRLMSGSSLIIYGNPWTNNNANNIVNKFAKKRIGKTLIASIIMKEAIYQRVKPDRAADSYAWAKFNLFSNRLMENASNGSFESEISTYQFADWLVIDDIEIDKGSENGKQFRINVLNKFFSERIDSNLPTILVFQDDLSKISNLQMEFGNSICEIINSRKTHNVALLEGK